MADAKGKAHEKAIFKLFSPGVNTARDEWVIDLDSENLLAKMTFFHNVYLQAQRDGLPLDSRLKNSRNLSRRFTSGLTGAVDRSLVFDTLYRPYVKRRIHDSRVYID